ncbi:methyltransferase [Maricaulis sp.]|uniref:class I SAM-dependent methyltransferase n=1 Tax=Maricaulis sp. TaxID=1486257 RepID=UPI0026303396|nr:methyltransferase [Maricaulis sp.]
MYRNSLPLIGLAALTLSACSNGAETETAATEAAATDTAAAPAATATETAAPATTGVASLDAAIAGEWRGDRSERDGFRNPAETITFFEIDPSSTVLEIWPGGGWYADILAPWIAGNGGTYVAAHFPADAASEGRRGSRERFEQRYADTALYGDIVMAGFDDTTEALAEPGSIDTILTFRNVHNWMMGNYAEKAFADFYAALREGGTLGVVEHRLPSTREQSSNGGSGYVQQAYVIRLAEEAGFELVGSSEVNANPADTADHPFGVWTLPPVRRSAGRGEEPAEDFDRAFYDAIGESDRMTLLFRKPEGASE